MPLYEYRCPQCHYVTSRLWPNYSPPATTRCQGCGVEEAERRISTFAFHKSAQTKMEELDPKYDKMVDQAIKTAPPTTDPEYHLRKMAPFSQARE